MFNFLKILKLFIAVVFVITSFFVVQNFALAQVEVTDDLGSTFGLGTRGLHSTLVNIVNAALGFLGVIAISIILYGGFIWMTSGGVAEKIAKAKKILINGLIGLVIILFAFAIVQFIFRSVGRGGTPTDPGGNSSGNGALGGGIIESVYPAPGQRNVARNTKIAVTFKEAMDPASVIADTNASGTLGDWVDDGDGILEVGEYDTIAVDNSAIPHIKIAKQGELILGPYITEVFVTKTADDMTFVFDPIPLLGNASYNEWYTTELTGNINKVDGTPAFGALGGFDWSFEIGTYVDTTPPYITRVFPMAGGTYAKNAVIQIQFSEAIDPTAVVNTNIIVDSVGTSPVPGTLYIANQYRTVEFLGSLCGTNSCNEVIYCLPGNESITVTALAATLTGEPPLAVGPPYDGIVDMVGNSLDGNHNGTAEGQGADDYVWNFNTTNQIELTPSTISSVTPASGDVGATLREPVEVLFSELMMYSSLRTTSLKIISPIVDYWITADDIPPILPAQTRAQINHSRFDTATVYKPEATSEVKDMYQNCFYPSSSPSCAGSPYCCDEIPSAIPCP